MFTASILPGMELFLRKWSGFADAVMVPRGRNISPASSLQPLYSPVLCWNSPVAESVTSTGAQVVDLERNPRKLLGGWGTVREGGDSSVSSAVK